MEKHDGNPNQRNRYKTAYGQDESISIRIAKTKEAIEEFQKFLFQTYCVQLKWCNQHNFPNRLLTDKYDNKSSFITVHSGSEIVAGMRLVRNSTLGFPHNEQDGICLPDLGKFVDIDTRERILNIGKNKMLEVTRLVGKKTSKRVLTIDLTKGLYWYCASNGIDACLMVADMNLFLLCERLCIPLRPVGIPKYCEGSWVVPSILILEEVMDNLNRKNPEVWEYILNQSGLAGNWED